MLLPLHDRNPIRHITRPYVNWSLIGVTCLVFLVQTLAPRGLNDAINVSLGLIPVVVSGEVPHPVLYIPEQVTLVSYAFLHIDLMHLLTNMLFLFVFGDNIEDALGHVRYLVFYFACAAIAGLAHMAGSPFSYAPLIGASGAVAGVMGAYAVLFPHARVIVLARIVIPFPLPLPAIAMLGFWLLSQMVYFALGSQDQVSWIAHIAGMASGAVLAVFMRRRGVMLFGGR